MKKIFINGRFLTQYITGVQRYAVEVIKVIDKLIGMKLNNHNESLVILLVPRKCSPQIDLKHIIIKPVGIFSGHLWEQIELPYYSRDGLLISLCNAAPIMKFNQVVTIHDAAVFAFPQAYSFMFRTWYKILLFCLGKVARKVITDSLFSKEDLIHYSGVDRKKVHIIYLGKEHIFNHQTDQSILTKHNLNNQQFILAVSSMNPSKNFESIIRAIQFIDNEEIKFVIAGATNAKIFSESTEILPKCIKYVGYISDEELKALYEHASCFVYPSYYEGFGLPPLEAMACGCPVIVSNAASLPEVCGDGALYCDPYNPKDIANKIQLILNDATLRTTLIKKGLEQSKLFTWEKCTNEILNVVEEVIAK